MLQKEIRKDLNRIVKDIMHLKKRLICEGAKDKQSNEVAWKNLLIASKQISKEWSGASVVNEIREQRDKL